MWNKRKFIFVFLVLTVLSLLLTGCIQTTRNVMEPQAETETTKESSNSASQEEAVLEQDRQDEAGVTYTGEIVGQWNSTQIVEGNVIELIVTIGSDNHFSFYEGVVGENTDASLSPTQSITASANGTYTIDGNTIIFDYQDLIGGNEALTKEFIDENLRNKEVSYTFSVSEHRLVLTNSENQEYVFKKSQTE